ncbi:MAG: purine-nucleoside phosphorylase [Selenomonadaceae bacterium]|nr:purine-nucleoside phosphorylase [Selenomonadaceae bacterium]
MSTPHNAANIGDIAERVLLPGDPLRAKHIAETFMEDVKLYTDIRNVYGYTGKYKGVPISVQATGMGIPSFSIYVHELINVYGAKKLLRVGTCGGMHEDAKLRDVIVAQGVTTDSSIIHQVFGGAVNYALIANFNLLEKAVNNARKLNMSVEVGNIICTDRFYNDYDDINGVFGDGKRSLNEKLVQYGILAVEMETAALYLLTAEAGVQGLGIFTVSDQLLTHERIPSHERETTFNDMVKIALETAIED